LRRGRDRQTPYDDADRQCRNTVGASAHSAPQGGVLLSSCRLLR
jgi:hypothetical protein